MNVSIFITERSDYLQDFERADSKIVLGRYQVTAFVYDWNVTITEPTLYNISISDRVKNNMTSIYAHMYISINQVNCDIKRGCYDNIYKVYPLVIYKPKPKDNQLKKLLDSEETVAAVETESSSLHGYWKPSFHLNFVLDFPQTFSRNSIPPTIGRYINFTSSGSYYPIVYSNDFWVLSSHYLPINHTTDTMPLEVSISTISFWKWQIQTSLQDQWNKGHSGTTEKENDMLRETLLSTSPTLLVITAIVTLLHTLFDFLAFKNDIQFWKNRKNMQGLSIHSLSINCFFQTIIVLYLYDNDTSYVILISSTIGLLIEYWKLAKAFNIRINIFEKRQENSDTDADSGTGTAEGTNKSIISVGGVSSSYSQHDTSHYDTEATTHLLYLVIPLLVGYSLYSIIYNSHKSYYSWILNSLVGFVYAFGFIMMTPQLYINYKLKSTAHMPWKAMVYKALNTFIDDLFAFIIKMPILHRLACFRDDIIFVIYLYQKYAYRVDYSRVNEYGQGGDHNVNAKLPISGGAVIGQDDDATTDGNDPKRDFDDGGGGEEHSVNANS